ncbi:MAG: hypothetical protein V3V08_15630 [Nannocystaceae bacterium]
MTEQWSLVAGHLPHPLLAALLVAVAVAAMAEAGWNARRKHRSSVRTEERWAAGAAFGFRVIGVLAVLAAAFEPSLRVESVVPTRQAVVVLLDTSASMQVADATDAQASPVPRIARARLTWQQSREALRRWAGAGLDVSIRSFSDAISAHSGDPSQMLAAQPDGGASNLAEALAELVEASPAAVVIISDGLVARSDAEREQVRSTAQALGVPITTVATGAPHLVDVSVAKLRCGEFAFVENVVAFELDVESHGLAGTRTVVELRRDGEVVAQKSITLEQDGTLQTLRFERAPDRVGQFVYEFRIPEAAGETTTTNNRQAFVVNVLRDKVRALHVAGRPNWDVRALRTLLQRDPNVELLSYYILRDWEDIDREDRTAKLSLIAFPTDELFREELGSFDLLVLHNFDAVRYGAYLDNIATYVRNGGALVVIGGDLGLATGEYAARPLASLLPLDTRRPTGLDRSPFRPQITDAGRRHPITAWLARTPKGWGQLPELDSFNFTGYAPLEEDMRAATLLVHPDLRTSDGRLAPLLAVAEPGKGRTMVLATGATWRLGFAHDLALVSGSRPYDLLWLGAVRWLLRDGSSERLVLDLDRTSYRPGDPVHLGARALSASYEAEPDAEIEWEIRPLDDTARESGDPMPRGRWTTDAMGRAQSTLGPLSNGAYEALAQRVGAPADSGEDRVRRVFLIESPTRELATIDADPGTELLAELAAYTSGHALAAANGDTLPLRLALRPADANERRGRIEARRDQPLWDGWTALIVLISALAGDWLLRRRYGLT